jgi:hypothetical protein
MDAVSKNGAAAFIFRAQTAFVSVSRTGESRRLAFLPKDARSGKPFSNSRVLKARNALVNRCRFREHAARTYAGSRKAEI